MMNCLRKKKYWANITDAGHYSFSNACDLVSTYPDCGPGFLEHREVHHLVNTVTTAFLQKYRGMENMDAFLPVVDDRISLGTRIRKQESMSHTKIFS